MKNFIISIVITLALICYFSFCGCTPMETQSADGYTPRYKGDSGPIIPGDGDLLADSIIEPGNTTEPPQSMGETEKTITETMTKTNKTITREKNKMDGIVLSFWHGVATVLIGETVALMVAVAWMKIKGKDNGK